MTLEKAFSDKSKTVIAEWFILGILKESLSFFEIKTIGNMDWKRNEGITPVNEFLLKFTSNKLLQNAINSGKLPLKLLPERFTSFNYVSSLIELGTSP